jgi:RNA polymerase sigma-70 factor (ECF subfamily)
MPLARHPGQPVAPAQRLRVAFENLWQAHRRELLVHCYRMLGSWIDAEDVLQDVSLRAWRGLPRFAARASARAWLYRIATNACLTALRRRRERSLPEVLHSAAPAGGPLGPPVEEARWIQPFPTGADTDVEAVASSRESVTLAFIVALQCLPPRQRAALLLRDVIGYEASEVATMLKTTAPAVNSALIRARSRLARFRRRHGPEPRIAPLSAGQQKLLTRYVEAWESGDVDAIVSLLSRDASVSMPPYATWYRGRAAIARWLIDHIFADRRVYRLRPTFANGRPAFAIYESRGPSLSREDDSRAFAAHCIQVLWIARRHIVRAVSFLNPRLVKEFGFPSRLPGGSSRK